MSSAAANRPIRIALVSQSAASDARSWSGIPTAVLQALEVEGTDVVDVSPLAVPNLRARYARHVITRRVTGVGARYELDRSVRRAFAREASRRCRAADVDAVLSLGTLAVTELEGEWPVACWCDATLEDLTHLYAEYSRVPTRRRAEAVAAEGIAMRRSTLTAFASPWAAESARRQHGLSAAQTAVVPFGANLGGLADGAALDAAIGSRGGDRLELLWIGLDWGRKRGRFCVDVLEALERRGVAARLTMVGARPDDGRDLPDVVEHVGFVDKNDPDARRLLERLLSRSHVVLLPSRAECFGIAIAEGNAYGVPAAAAAVGGIPGALTDGTNGALLAGDATPSEYAEVVVSMTQDPERYRLLARRAHAEWKLRLNWGASVRTIVGHLTQAAGREAS